MRIIENNEIKLVFSFENTLLKYIVILICIFAVFMARNNFRTVRIILSKNDTIVNCNIKYDYLCGLWTKQIPVNNLIKARLLEYGDEKIKYSNIVLVSATKEIKLKFYSSNRNKQNMVKEINDFVFFSKASHYIVKSKTSLWLPLLVLLGFLGLFLGVPFLKKDMIECSFDKQQQKLFLKYSKLFKTIVEAYPLSQISEIKIKKGNEEDNDYYYPCLVIGNKLIKLGAINGKKNAEMVYKLIESFLNFKLGRPVN